jgi:hypothetical protein
MILRFSDRALRSTEAPLGEDGRISVASATVQGEITSKIEKTPHSPSAAGEGAAGNFGVRQFGMFPPHLTNVNHLTGLTTGPISGYEQKIISSIKTFRKKN